MKQLFKFSAVAFAIVSTAACSKQEIISQSVQEGLVPVTVSACLEDTRAAIQADGKVFWSKGDQIAVWVGDTRYTLTLSSGEGTSSGTFSGLAAEGDIQGAVSPAGAASDAVKAYTLPTSQTISEGASNDPDAIVMVADAPAAGGSLAFKNVCGGIRVSVAGAAAKVVFKSGEAIVETSVPGAGTYNILLPVADYKGFTIATVYADKYLFTSSEKTLAITASKLYNIPATAEELPFAITTAAHMKALAEHVDFFGPSHTFTLGADIDFGGDAITPIGDGLYVGATTISGRAFTSTFDGQNHTVDNFKMTGSTNNVCLGLFGIIEGTVKNLNVGSKASYSMTKDIKSHTGGVVAYMRSGYMENCHSQAQFEISGGKDAQRTVVGGVLGLLICQKDDLTIKNCSFDKGGHISAVNKVNKNNGANGFQIGGVVGMADCGDAGNKKYSIVENCCNYVDFDFESVTRIGGIVGTSNKWTKLKGCSNYGNIISRDVMKISSRPAGITSATGANVEVNDCVNYGNITGTEGNCYSAGIVGQTNDNTDVIDGCINYGTVLSDLINASDDNAKYTGIIVGNPNSKSVAVKNCGVGGKIGPYTDSETKTITITEENFASYITCVKGSRSANLKLENNYFASADK